MNYIKQSRGSHWYTREGYPMHTVTGKDGERATNVGDARKLDLLPSVTNIIGVLAKPGLDSWKQNQVLAHSLTLPKIEGESVDDFAKRVSGDYQVSGQKHLDLGSRVHAAIAEYIKSGRIPEKELFPYLRAYLDWLEKNNLTVVSSEKTIVGPKENKDECDYAGTYDLIVKNAFNATLLTDIKTGTLKKGRVKIVDEWIIQNAAYNKKTLCDGVANLVLDKSEPGKFGEVYYSADEEQKGWELFSHCKAIWKIQKQYDPLKVKV